VRSCARASFSVTATDFVANRFVCAEPESYALRNLHSPRAPTKKLTFLPVFGWLGSRSSLGSIASAIYVIHVAAYPDRRKQLMSDKLTNARAEKRKDPPTPKKPPIKEPKKKEKPVGDPPSQRRPIRSVRREPSTSQTKYEPIESTGGHRKMASRSARSVASERYCLPA
jgi:hypothetical protein